MGSNVEKTTVRPYVQANVGTENYANSYIPNATAEIGARLTKGNLRAEAGLRAGTEVGAQANVNYRLPISEKAGVNFQGNASYSRPFIGGQKHVLMYGTPDAVQTLETSFRPDRYKAAAGVGMDIKPNEKLTLNFGLEAGVLGCNGSKSVEVVTPQSTTRVAFQGNPSPYVSPTAGVNYKLNDKFNLNMQADISEVTAGIRYVF